MWKTNSTRIHVVIRPHRALYSLILDVFCCTKSTSGFLHSSPHRLSGSRSANAHAVLSFWLFNILKPWRSASDAGETIHTLTVRQLGLNLKKSMNRKAAAVFHKSKLGLRGNESECTRGRVKHEGRNVKARGSFSHTAVREPGFTVRARAEPCCPVSYVNVNISATPQSEL